MATCNIIAAFVLHVLAPGVQVLLAMGFFFFFYGILIYMWDISQGGEGDAGKKHLLWGLIGVVVMVSSSGIIALIINSLSLNGYLLTC